VCGNQFGAQALALRIRIACTRTADSNDVHTRPYDHTSRRALARCLPLLDDSHDFPTILEFGFSLKFFG
jgi:hypothetical protein